MTPKNDIFLLIKALTKSEKGYFKKFCSIYSDNKKSIYVELFDCIDEMLEYDEKVIRARFKSSKMLTQLHVRKNYLFKLLLRSLRSFHNDNTIETEINNSIHEGSILKEKGLYTLAFDVFKNTKKKAEKYELFSKQIDINKKIIEILDYVDDWKLPRNKEYFKNSILAKEIADIEEITSLRIQMGRLYREMMNTKNVTRVKKEAQKIIRSRVLSNIKKIKSSPLMLEAYYKAHSFNAIINGNYAEEYKYKKKHADLLAKNQNLGINRPDLYLTAIASMCASQTSLKKVNELKISIEKLESLRNHNAFKSKHLDQKIFEYLTLYKGIYLSLTGDLKKLTQFANEVNHDLIKYEKHLSSYNYSFICYNLALTLFFSSRYRDSIRWINKIVLNKNGDLPVEITNATQLLKLMSYYEEGDYDFVEYESKALINVFSSQKSIATDMHILVANYFNKYFTANISDKEKLVYYKKLKSTIENRVSRSTERISNNYLLNVCVWLNAKIKAVNPI